MNVPANPSSPFMSYNFPEGVKPTITAAVKVAETRPGQFTLSQEVTLNGVDYTVRLFLKNPKTKAEIEADPTIGKKMADSVSKMVGLAIAFNVGKVRKDKSQLKGLKLSGDGSKIIKLLNKGQDKEKDLITLLSKKHTNFEEKQKKCTDEAKDKLKLRLGTINFIMENFLTATPNNITELNIGTLSEDDAEIKRNSKESVQKKSSKALQSDLALNSANFVSEKNNRSTNSHKQPGLILEEDNSLPNSTTNNHDLSQSPEKIEVFEENMNKWDLHDLLSNFFFYNEQMSKAKPGPGASQLTGEQIEESKNKLNNIKEFLNKKLTSRLLHQYLQNVVLDFATETNKSSSENSSLNNINLKARIEILKNICKERIGDSPEIIKFKEAMQQKMKYLSELTDIICEVANNPPSTSLASLKNDLVKEIESLKGLDTDIKPVTKSANPNKNSWIQ